MPLMTMRPKSNRKYNFNMADFCFPKQEVVISQPYIMIGLSADIWAAIDLDDVITAVGGPK